jgi:hypothetical protein
MGSHKNLVPNERWYQFNDPIVQPVSHDKTTLPGKSALLPPLAKICPPTFGKKNQHISTTQ